MKTRQTFEDIRNRKKERLTLRVRMVLWVQVELLACVGLAFLIDNIAHTLNPNWNIPLLLELVIVSVVVGGVMTAIISRAFFNPVKNLRQAMDKVANGDFTIQLDPISEANVYLLFKEASKNKTTIFITHRLAVSKLVDKIILINNGKIEEMGTHQTLIELGGIYAEMFKKQSEWYQSN